MQFEQFIYLSVSSTSKANQIDLVDGTDCH